MDNAIDPATSTVKLRASFAQADERLWPGEFVYTALSLSKRPDALVVSEAPVKAGADGRYVFSQGRLRRAARGRWELHPSRLR